ncbi:MAG: response regulator [Desulfobacteraceae bacterium]|nr:MAG: response regulator [Desulfobacteraceae bacterium]
MSKKKKILVVEDEQDVLTYLTTLFQDNGYDTVSAVDGVEAFEKARTEKPDLISLDIVMPDQSGVRTYRQYKKDDELKDIPVIIVTALGDSMRSFLKRLGGFPEPEGFMTKPIDEEKLLKMAADLLSK